MNTRSPLVKGVLLVGEQFHGMDNIPEEMPKDSEEVQLMERRFALPESYNLLAWSAFLGLRKCVLEHTPVEHIGRVESLAGVRGAAHRGIRQMVRFASFIPLIYADQHEGFNDSSVTPEEQLRAVAGIASRSLKPLETIAAQPTPIAGSLEDNLYLRGDYWSAGAYVGFVNNLFILRGENEDAAVELRDETEANLRGIREKTYPNSHNGQFAQGPGCMALRLSANNEGSVLNDVWQAIVANASSAPTLFAQSLQRLHEIRERRGYLKQPPMRLF